ncbi:2-C-methyl-D-erythritol 4-phosphate cytidylyltransferase [Lacrimispora saccharolytica]|uniref:2-C-methyl-D-erythritol 4-phosphate cytidylyltransferase n=1 Tax=Lacrimispora saccharolytica (strain ATCC 35040 / DSM 2544 / NRCC 2533 / WM1) TaxID=610130 RepID=D9R4S3_LACSW|nr:2-C-methyl-D-erythritol 4-phosphate cytidylyltransferase [Lacrimispora saccharolytica]ADL03257.1 2-C-methyl-D-erythritol 4-phosphate cytidylyltransferase [[Clostridium] saccharolyticum WM1]QRV18573.1 2-C-methyl-D-erythritol 4-phosphate cytidylyltransferase [Lacrimispora saccharolytica]
MEDRRRTAAVILAAGKGTRMGSQVHKQYMELFGKPLLYYALLAFENSSVDEIVLVTGPGEVRYCREEIVGKYGFSKVTAVTEGGKERYHSVYEGLKAVTNCDYVLVHDGARPCVTGEIIEAASQGARQHKACAVGMPVKDTIKMSDENEFAAITPDRNRLWMIQTPQAFEYELVLRAYEKLMSSEKYQKGVTDDAMVVETMTQEKVKLIRGDYANIKITTPEDMEIAAVLIKRNQRDK